MSKDHIPPSPNEPRLWLIPTQSIAILHTASLEDIEGSEGSNIYLALAQIACMKSSSSHLGPVHALQSGFQLRLHAPALITDLTL